MKRIYRQLLITAATCALALGAIASTKKPVQLPLAWKGTSVIQLDMSGITPIMSDGNIVGYTLPWSIVRETGTMEHLGLYTSHGGGVVVLGVDFSLLGLSGDGYVTAANGDKLYWHEEQVGENPAVLTFEPGTGRFQDAAGMATDVVTLVAETPAGTVYSVSGQGWISY